MICKKCIEELSHTLELMKILSPNWDKCSYSVGYNKAIEEIIQLLSEQLEMGGKK